MSNGIQRRYRVVLWARDAQGLPALRTYFITTEGGPIVAGITAIRRAHEEGLTDIDVRLVERIDNGSP